MAPVPGGKSCIDRWEATLEDGERGTRDAVGTTVKAVSKAGTIPAVQVSQLQAAAACVNAGKRLCSRAEWMLACRGVENRKFPYGGDTWIPERCADRTLRDKRKLRAPLPTGSLEGCRTPEGVYDLSGNVWEWLSDTGPRGNPGELIGGGYGNDDDDDFLACVSEDGMAQPVTRQSEAVGLRCCRDARAR